ncbi:MAG: hypothetical protein Q9211_002718 [Gyalolechia sp. 1 TL-2023]
MADYNRLASMIAHHGEAAIFRRFDTLNIKNLLYMQAELVHLEAELHQIENDERSSADPSKDLYPFSVHDLRASASGSSVTQWTKYQEIQSKIQMYKWLERSEGGNFFLKGREAPIWEAEDDLVSLDSRQRDKDALTSFINEKVVPWYHRRWGYRTKVKLCKMI